MIIGYTQSGKAVYDSLHTRYASDFTGQDHADAMTLHQVACKGKKGEAFTNHHGAYMFHTLRLPENVNAPLLP